MEKIVSPIFSVPLRFEKEKKKKKNITRIRSKDRRNKRVSFQKKILLICESSSASFFLKIFVN